jgi:hypothetical protein
VEAALLADLHLLVAVAVEARRRILAAGAQLALLQVEADDARPGGVQRVVVGAIELPVGPG